jgi:uncharacterized protein (DUF697 family)
MFDRLKRWLSRADRPDGQVRDRLEKLRQRTPVPLFWLFGKTQTGKTSIIKFLTGADQGEIGQGFQACTRFSREYQFPTAEAPLLVFLDTRGVDEPGYDPAEDLRQFGDRAHVVLVTVKVLDHAQENTLMHLRTIRAAHPDRPVVLALTCLHEAYPQQQHPEPYPFLVPAAEEQQSNGRTVPRPAAGAHTPHCPLPAANCPPDLARSVAEQCLRFGDLVDAVVPIDLTRPEDGFTEANYGGDHLKRVLLGVLPGAYRQTLLTLEEANHELKDLYARRVLPHIVGYSTLAATAGAVPIPWLDLLILPGIQTRMIYHLARLYGRPLDGTQFLELASTLGLGVVLRQAAREVVKFIPYVGSVFGGAVAAASTFALGKAFCYYYSEIHQGHVPSPEDLKRYYHDQLTLARQAWKLVHAGGARHATNP